MIQAAMLTFRDFALRLKQVYGLVRLRPFSVSTVAGRTNERHRRAALTALAAVLARSLSIATALITVPLTLHYLGTERYGMWMTMSSLVVLLSFADLGIGTGILNSVSSAYGKDDFAAIREYVSSGVLVLSAIALCIIGTFAGLYHIVPWYEIFNVNSIQAKQEAGPALAVLSACFALAIPLGVVQRVQMGLQKGFIANLWQCFSSLLALCGVILAIWLKADLPWLVLAFAGSPLFASLLNSISYFGWLQPESAPAYKFVSGRAMRHIAHIGILFFLLQVAGSFIFTSDNIVIAQLLGAHAVAAYAVPQRLFTIIPTLLGMGLMPLWPAYGEALARGDHAWVWRTLKRSFFTSVGLAALGSIILVWAGNWIITLWVGNVIATSMLLLVGLGVLQVVLAGGFAVSMYMNGANILHVQIIVGVITAILAIALKIYLVPIIGISGVVWATISSWVLCTGIPIYFLLRKKKGGSVTGQPDTRRWSSPDFLDQPR